MSGTVRVVLMLTVILVDLQDIQLFLVALKKLKLRSLIYLSDYDLFERFARENGEERYSVNR